MYFTAVGSIEPFENVVDPENPSFLITSFAGNSNSIYSQGSSKVFASSTIVVDNIPSIGFFPTQQVPQILVRYSGYPNPDDEHEVKLKISSNGDIVDYATGSIIVGAITAGTNTGTKKMTIVGSTSIPELDFTDPNLNNFLVNNQNLLKVLWYHNIENDVIMTLYQKTPREVPTEFTIKFIDTRSTINGTPNIFRNTMTFSFRELLYGSQYYNSPVFIVSPELGKVDGFGASLYVEDVLADNLFIGSKVYKQFTDPRPGQFPWESNPNAPPISRPVTGKRVLLDPSFTEADIVPSLQEGWDLCVGPDFENVKIFFDPEAKDSLKTKFASMRATTHKFSTFISGVRVPVNSPSAAVTTLTTARAALPSVTGLAYYCNEVLNKETYTGSEFWSIPIGSVAAMLVRIMDIRYGGAAPMFVNTADGVGGQLPKSVKKIKYHFDADQLEALDSIGLNPIILDAYYGLMITSQRTAQSPAMLTDWSFLGHQMAFDLLKDEIRVNVMIPQIGKPINTFYMDLRYAQAQAILNKRLLGPGAIWSAGQVLVREVNTPETKAENKFVIKIRVKVNPFSEYVELVFNNVGQLTEIS